MYIVHIFSSRSVIYIQSYIASKRGFEVALLSLTMLRGVSGQPGNNYVMALQISYSYTVESGF